MYTVNITMRLKAKTKPQILVLRKISSAEINNSINGTAQETHEAKALKRGDWPICT